MKMSVKAMQTYFPGCMPNCYCANKHGEDYAQFKVRMHLAQPTGKVIQAVDVTCDCCGKSAYTPVAHLGLTRDELKL
jgi:hypothetical protein